MPAEEKKSASKKKATRGSLAFGRSRASLDGRGESRGVGRGGGCGRVRGQKSHRSGDHSEENKKTMMTV